MLDARARQPRRQPRHRGDVSVARAVVRGAGLLQEGARARAARSGSRTRGRDAFENVVVAAAARRRPKPRRRRSRTCSTSIRCSNNWAAAPSQAGESPSRDRCRHAVTPSALDKVELRRTTAIRLRSSSASCARARSSAVTRRSWRARPTARHRPACDGGTRRLARRDRHRPRATSIGLMQIAPARFICASPGAGLRDLHARGRTRRAADHVVFERRVPDRPVRIGGRRW